MGHYEEHEVEESICARRRGVKSLPGKDKHEAHGTSPCRAIASPTSH